MTLRCATCGEPALQLLSEDTRGTTITRRRRCSNQHVTKTIETYAAITQMTRHLKDFDEVLTHRAALWKRDQRIVRAVEAGRGKAEVAAEFGLAPNSVSSVLRRHAPGLLRRVTPSRARAPEPAPQPTAAAPRTVWRFPGAAPWANT
jgi:hypothetical protein